MNDTNDRDRDRNDDQPTGLFRAIRGVLEALGEAEHEGKSEVRRSGRIPKGHFTTSYGIRGRTIDSESDSKLGSDSERQAEESYLVDVRYEDGDDELQIVADLPDVEADELTVGLDEDRNELVIGVENRPIKRLELPWPVETADSSFHHGVLELRFTPREEE